MSRTDNSKSDKLARIGPDRVLGYSDFGDPHGKPLLYFHGGFSSRVDIAWADQYCKSNGVRLIAPDRPGTGLSPTQGRRTLPMWAVDVEQFLNTLEISSVPVLGWSLGGPYVFVCAERLPHLIPKVATIGACPEIDSPKKIAELGLLVDRWLLTCPENLEWLLAICIIFGAYLPAPILKEVVLSELKAASDKKTVAALSPKEATEFLYESLKQGPRGVIDDYKAVALPWEFLVENINIDVDLWHGTADSLCPPSFGEELQKRIPKAKLNVVPDEGHFLLHKHLPKILESLMS